MELDAGELSMENGEYGEQIRACTSNRFLTVP
jgi:hypothetical protein